MSNTSISLTSLDFDTLKTNFQSYLTSQSAFKDYNFTGSNINVLLDVMSYNTYLNSFYLNMVASEMFLDSAQKLDSVVSHAKELNYLPRSSKSAVANVSFTVTSDKSPLSIAKGTTFSGQNSNGSFTFTTAVNQNFKQIAPNSYSVENLQIYEGSYIQDAFVVDYTQEFQRFILSNSNIDIDSLTVTVIEGGVSTEFAAAETLFGLNNTSTVYFIQSAQNNQYEIVFGDNNLGRKPKNLAVIVADYRVTKGDLAQEVSSFLLVSPIDINNLTATVSTITTVSNSSGGAASESIESIRKSAPRYFATQQRAVSSDDYASLVKSKFGGQISDISVYGGELLEPKQYGRVAVCLKPAGGTITPNYVKEQVKDYLLPYVSLPTRVIITDPDYMYIGVNSTVQYNVTGTLKLASEIKTLITSAIKQYSADNIELFDNDFRYSKFVSYIDGTDTSITSNSTDITMIKRLFPVLNVPFKNQVVYFNNPSDLEDENKSIGYVKGSPFYDEPMLTSSPFTYVAADGTEYVNCNIRDDNYGKLVVYSLINNKFTIINGDVGTLNYNTGQVTISEITTSYYGNYISLYLKPKNKDIIVSRDKILIIDLADVNVDVIPTQK